MEKRKNRKEFAEKYKFFPSASSTIHGIPRKTPISSFPQGAIIRRNPTAAETGLPDPQPESPAAYIQNHSIFVPGLQDFSKKVVHFLNKFFGGAERRGRKKAALPGGAI
jgi:hypothetical protein